MKKISEAIEKQMYQEKNRPTRITSLFGDAIRKSAPVIKINRVNKK